MAHRGRLNVMANILDKSVREIFAAFEDADPERFLGGGDVKYHLGYSSDRRHRASGKKVHLTLTFNPSHLEFVDPVVEGRARAKQDRLRRLADARRRVVPLLIHGDAAFIGQGVVAETLNLGGLSGYATGGTIHVIVNNQIGFTTDVVEARCTRYASDVVRMLKVPVFHVNGEDPEAVAAVAHLAVELRQRFGKDVVIDMYCYRRHGHNEGDEPRYTQPLMYQAIDRKPTVRQMYVKRLLGMGHVTVERADEIVARRREALAAALDEVKQQGLRAGDLREGGVWSSYRGGPDAARPRCPPPSRRRRSARSPRSSWSCPRASHPTPRSSRSSRRGTTRSSAASPSTGARARCSPTPRLLAEKTPVRISGQDVKRGTFSHRHAVLCDMRTGEEYVPLERVGRAPRPPRHPQQPPLRAGRARLRVRLQPRLPRRARDLGGAVRRLPQRRAGDRRPVHHVERGQVAPALAASCSTCRTATRARAPSTRARASSASSRTAPRTTSRSVNLDDARAALPRAAPPGAAPLPQAARRS